MVQVLHIFILNAMIAFSLEIVEMAPPLNLLLPALRERSSLWLVLRLYLLNFGEEL